MATLPDVSAPHLLRPLAPVACLLALGACGSGGGAAAATHASRPPNSRHHRRAPATAALRPLSYRSLYSLPAPVQDPAAAPLSSHTFALLGGLTAADTSTDQVLFGGLRSASVRTSLPNAQHDAEATTLAGQVYLFGGGQFTQYDHILALDPSGASVRQVGTLPAAASDVAVAGDGTTAYVVGGFDGTNWLNTIIAYRPGTTPQVVARLPVALRYAAATFADGFLVIAGGSTPTGVSDSIYRFDPRTARLTRLGRLPAPVTHAAAGAINGTVYLLGGRGASVTDRTAAIWALDPATGRMAAAGKLPQPTSDAGVVSLGDRLVIAGGATAAGTQAGVAELLPASG